MSKKDFVALALHLAYDRPEISTASDRRRTQDMHDMWNACIHAAANVCAASSPRFDRERFLDACRTWKTEIRDGRLVRAK